MSHSPPTFQGGPPWQPPPTSSSLRASSTCPPRSPSGAAPTSGRWPARRPDLVAAQAQAADLALTVERQQREIDRLRLPITDAADDRLAAIWEKGEQIANDEGFCSEYDRLVEAIGGTPRERDFRVTLSVTLTQRVPSRSPPARRTKRKTSRSRRTPSKTVIESLRSDNYVADSIDAEVNRLGARVTQPLAGRAHRPPRPLAALAAANVGGPRSL
ncbi:hypothetical protein AB1285_26890 [Microbacterium sp. NRRL B-14842]|uniref:hypothetical protein n=1 Tax=Microbacterium sp. NRRL B-14842 TaxID=3162881 RepID=UPI003D2E1D73